MELARYEILSWRNLHLVDAGTWIVFEHNHGSGACLLPSLTVLLTAQWRQGKSLRVFAAGRGLFFRGPTVAVFPLIIGWSHTTPPPVTIKETSSRTEIA